MKLRIIVFLAIIFLSACNSSNKTDSNNETLSVSITLASLPETITYNKETTPDGHIEYEWGVAFDITGDGVINQGDVSLKILEYKHTGLPEQVSRISDLDANLWLYTDDTTTETIAAVTSQVSENTITFSINKSEHESLNHINESTLVYFETTAFEDNDYHPGYYNTISIPPDGAFTDPQGDAATPSIDMISMSVSLSTN